MRFRVDIVQLSSEEKPTSGIENGTTLYYVDTGALFVYYKGTWYEQNFEESEEE